MKKQLTDIAAQYEQARLRLKGAISKLPDSAEGVKMLGHGCASVPLSLIGQHGFNLSPCYWLTRETKAQLIELVDKNRSIEALITAIEGVLVTGKLRDGTKLPPNIVGALKTAWKG